MDRRLLPHIDWPLLIAIVGLMVIGLAMIYNLTWDFKHNIAGRQFWTQIYAIGLSLIVLVACLVVDYRTLVQRAFLIYFVIVVLLVCVALFGVVRNNARRWIPLHGILFQPSEFARIGVALVLAMYYGESRRSARALGNLVAGGLLVVVPFYLIKREPDLGTSVALIPVFVGIAYLAGLRMRWFVAGGLVLVLLSPLIWHYGMSEVQHARVLTFVDPTTDPHGTGYQQIQARITVGSGGLFGKGFGAGTQGGYGFLPAASTDFVFAGLAEEHGFVGVLLALALYVFVIVRSIEAARLAKDKTGAYLVGGLISGFMFQVLYNISMQAGLAPVKGITLPLMSYGGSSLMATLAGFGLILNVRMRRFTN